LLIAFKCVQFFVLRIAEHEKGPVLAISALLAAVAALAKVFTGT
jgi:hypothetical protein